MDTETKISNIIDEVKAEFSLKSSEERAYILIKNYFSLLEEKCGKGEDVSEELCVSFWEWFEDPYGHTAKRTALERLFEETDRELQTYFLSSTP